MRSLSAILTGAALVIAAPVEALTLQSAALPSAIIGDRSDAIVRVAEGMRARRMARALGTLSRHTLLWSDARRRLRLRL